MSGVFTTLLVLIILALWAAILILMDVRSRRLWRVPDELGSNERDCKTAWLTELTNRIGSARSITDLKDRLQKLTAAIRDRKADRGEKQVKDLSELTVSQDGVCKATLEKVQEISQQFERLNSIVAGPGLVEKSVASLREALTRYVKNHSKNDENLRALTSLKDKIAEYRKACEAPEYERELAAESLKAIAKNLQDLDQSIKSHSSVDALDQLAATVPGTKLTESKLREYAHPVIDAVTELQQNVKTRNQNIRNITNELPAITDKLAEVGIRTARLYGK